MWKTKSFGYSPTAAPENCELSDRDSAALDIDNGAFFEVSEQHDYYELDRGGSGGRSGEGCIDGESD